MRSTAPAGGSRAAARSAHDVLVARGVHPDRARARVTAGVALAVARALRVDLPPLGLLGGWGPPVDAEVAPAEASPGLVGEVHEMLVGPGSRRAGGVVYTPAPVAEAVVAWALEGRSARHAVVGDPAVGGGAFLVAAAEVLARRGRPRGAVVAEALVGVDIDPLAVDVTEAVLALWCRGAAVPRVVVADALALDPAGWPERPEVVVGNPPFLNQLGRVTARSRATNTALRGRFGAAGAGYVDTAALFLVAGARLVRPGGTLALVLPESFLATRDARPARAEVLAGAILESLWVPDVPVFPGAAVRVCVPVLRRDGPRQRPVRLWRGQPPRLVAEVPTDADALATAPTWSHLLAEGAGVPDVELDGGTRLGEWCEVSADFRQHFYGLAPFVVDDPGGVHEGDRGFPLLVTSGLIDPARCLWGTRTTRHHRRAWSAPRVDLNGLEAGSDLGRWAQARLVPKVVVATQTRVLEAAVDAEGRWLPSTPVVSVVTAPDRLWHAAAALLAPPVTAWALRRWGGAALSSGALKLGAAQVRSVPSPRAGPDWNEAATAVRRAGEAPGEDERRRWLLEAARASSAAYGLDDPGVVEWWAARLPNRG